MAGIARRASRGARRALVGLVAASAWLAAPPSAAAEPNVTEVVVRFRDPGPADIGSAPSDAQLAIVGKALGTGIASWSGTLDGGFRITLAPSLPFGAARVAINRLRLNGGTLYASVAMTDAQGSPPRAVRAADAPAVPLFRLIVRYRDPRAEADAAAERPLDRVRLDAIAAIAGQPVVHERPIAWARAHLVQLFQPLPREQVEAIARALARDPDVLWAQPDYLDRIALIPNDPLYPNQWHYFEAAGGANLPSAWNRTTGWSGIRVAVTDTGALFGHPDLGTRFLGGYDFVVFGGSVDPRDGNDRDPNAADEGDWVFANECGPGEPGSNSSWHGTHVAGTIGAITNSASGVAGVNWVARIVPVRVLAKCGGFTSDVADGLVWATGGAVSGVPANPHPARVVNMSLSGFRQNQQCDPAYQTAANVASANNAVVVVAAGNGNQETSFHTPANCNGVITVASVGRSGQRATYSNFDDNDASGVQVDIAAPGGSFIDDGVGVLSTLNSAVTTPDPGGHNFVQYQGTSMATPHVAGIASLMLSLKPSLTPSQVLAILTSTARAFPSGTVRDCTSALGSVTATIKYCGAGIVDADAALTSIMTTGGPAGTAMTAATATLSSSLNPSTGGTPVTFTSNVTGSSPGGTVAFLDDETAIAGCDAVALTGAGNTRTAQCVTSTLPPGTRSIRAAFSGDLVNTPADSPTLAQVVNPGAPQPTATTLASSVNPANQGASVALTATVTGFTPGGTVLFRSNTVPITGCSAVPLVGAGNARTAQCTTTTLAVGNNAIEAIYGGDVFNLPSTGTLTQGIIGAGACAVFNDVSSSSLSCPSVQWIFNRLITTGCDVTSYCPASEVSRITMAAFMNREGSALTPIDLDTAAGNFSLILATPQYVCTTSDFAVTNFPRRAFLRARSNVYSPTANVDVAAELVYSTNAGGSWTAVPESMTFQTLYAGLSPADDKTVVPFGGLDLAVGSSYRFALRMSRAAGTGDVNVYCALAVQVGNRNPVSPPL